MCWGELRRAFWRGRVGVLQGGASSRGGVGGGAPVSRASAPQRSARSGPLAPACVGGVAHGFLPSHRRGIRPRALPPSSSSRRLAGPLLPARALPPSSSPPLAAASSSSSSLSLSICLSRPGIHSGLGAGAAWPPSARPPGRPAVCPPVRLSAGAPACPPAQVSAPPRPSAGPLSRPAWGRPRPETTLASDRGAAGTPVHPSNPHFPGPSRDPGALGGRTGICPARPFVMMLRWEGAGRGGGREGPVRAETSCGSPPSYEPPEISEPGRSPQARSRPNLKSEPVGATSSGGSRAWRPRPERGGGDVERGLAGWAWGAGREHPARH